MEPNIKTAHSGANLPERTVAYLQNVIAHAGKPKCTSFASVETAVRSRMVCNYVDVFRAGLLASFTGGWYFDSNAYVFSFTNAAHLYLWLFLLCYPFGLYLVN